MVCIFIILSKLRRIWSFSNIVVELACLSQLLGVVFRRRPCIRRIESEYKVRHYSGIVFIIQVLVVLQLVLAVIQAVVCVYSIQLSFRYWAERLGFKKYLGQCQIFNSSSTTQTFFFSLSKTGQPIILVLSTEVVQSSTILLLCSCIGSLLSGIFSTVGALYIILNTRLSSTKYLYRASLLLLAIPYRRQFLKQ